MTKRHKLGLIGYGTIGKVHRKIIQNPKSSFELVAISDIKKQEAPKGISFYKNHNELLDKEDIDAVSIATPPNTHFQIACDSLESNKHVLIEKPPTIDPKKCLELEKIANKNKVSLFTAFHMRYNPAVNQASKKLANTDIKKIEIIFKEYVFNFHGHGGWIFNSTISGGGVLMDSGINALSVVKSVLQNNPDFNIKEAVLSKENNMGVETKVRVKFTFGRNGVGTIKMDWLYESADIRKLIFYTKNKKYTININKGSLSENGQVLFKTDPKKNTMLIEYKGAYKHFKETIQQGVSFVSTDELHFVQNAYKKAL